MEQEHCARADSRLPFTTSNYGLTTCPADEFRVVLAADAAATAPPRRIPDYRELARSDRARRAGLTEVEIVAIVLYTGPMVRPGDLPIPRQPGRRGMGKAAEGCVDTLGWAGLPSPLSRVADRPSRALPCAMADCIFRFRL
jgi:hypothetical protein